MSEFFYSEEEQRALADSVQVPPDAHFKSDWQRLLKAPDYERLRADKEGTIARSLEISARECLIESEYPKSLKENLDTVNRIEERARGLLSDLKKPSHYRKNNAIAFLGVDRGWQRFGDQKLTPSHELLVELLTEIVDAAPFVENNFSRYHESHPFLRAHQPGFARFVWQALSFWQSWTAQSPGAGKEGGPAARFLMAAANPVITFASNELGIQLRRAGELHEAAAGELIAEYKRQREADCPDDDQEVTAAS